MTTPASAPSEVTSSDITPAAVTIHKIVIRPDYVPNILASLDPSAPPGRVAKQITASIDLKGGITFIIDYAPPAAA